MIKPARSNSLLIGSKAAHNTLLTSYDEIFHSHLNDDAEAAEDILPQQDPERIIRVEVLSAGSIIGQAIGQREVGLMIRDAKND